jgi:heterodisulfide reductase subunit B
MTRFAFFLGCSIPARVNQYEVSSRAVLGELGVELVDEGEFGCCGYPIRNVSFMGFLHASARNLALAEKRRLNILTLCKCCYGALRNADHLLRQDGRLKDRVNEVLQGEGLRYGGGIEVFHLLSVLNGPIGVEAIQTRIRKPFGSSPGVAVQYGCHALRPSAAVALDNPVSPTVFEKLVEVTGARCVPWKTSTQCCGAPLLGIDDELSGKLTKTKLEDARKSGADLLCVACPYCYLQFDTVQKMATGEKDYAHVPCVLYSQLLGVAMGLDVPCPHLR